MTPAGVQLDLFAECATASPVSPEVAASPEYLLWEAGALVPHMITRALDLAGLWGPEVDIACGAVEPAVDEWEAGTRYPTWEQALALADLCGVSMTWLTRTTDQHEGRWTGPMFLCGPRGCATLVEDGVERVLTFDVDAVRAVVGSE